MASNNNLVKQLIDSIMISRQRELVSHFGELSFSYNDIDKIHGKIFKSLSPTQIDKLNSILNSQEIMAINNYFDNHRIHEERPNIETWGKTRIHLNIVVGHEERKKSGIVIKALNNIIEINRQGEEETYYDTTYSGLNKTDYDHVNNTLKKHRTETFNNNTNSQIAEKISAIYQELDYLHGRWDGNSRSNRTYIQILGNKAGFSIDWDKIDRQVFYLARDKSLASKTMARNTQVQRLATTTTFIIEAIEELNKKNYDLSEVISLFIITPQQEAINYRNYQADQKISSSKAEALKLFTIPKIAQYSDFEIYQRKRTELQRCGIFALEGNDPPDWFKVLLLEIARGEATEDAIELDNFIEQIDRLKTKVAQMAIYGLSYHDL